MRSLMILLLSTSAAAAGLEQAGRPGNLPAAAKTETSPIVNVKRTDPVEVVYLEHAGPYWSLGPRFTLLQEHMLEHNQSGPMYARFTDDPTGAAAGSVHSEIGFIAEGDYEPTPPFKKSKREAGLVAYMIVGSHASTTRCYAAMREWIESHGYVALGPVTEVYPPLKRGVVRQQRTEIQMPIRSAATAIEASPPPVQEVMSEPARQVVATEEPQDLVAVEPSPEPGKVPIAAEDESISQPQPDESQRDRHEASEAEPVQQQPLAPVNDLIAVRQFDRIAEQLLPGPNAIPQAFQLWLGQLVFRIGAAVKGIKQMYPSDGQELTELGEAITRRYKSVSADFQLDPLAQAVVRVDPQSDPRAAERRAIMRDMDVLLGNIALRSVDIEETTRQLADVVQRTQDLLRAAQR